jgi:predicted tellurium resistance membrane protein TerC
LVLKLIDRFSVIIYAGGALLGYVAGEMLVSGTFPSTVLGEWFASVIEARHYLHWLIPMLCALLVLVVGGWLARHKTVENVVVDLVDEEVTAIPGKKT